MEIERDTLPAPPPDDCLEVDVVFDDSDPDRTDEYPVAFNVERLLEIAPPTSA